MIRYIIVDDEPIAHDIIKGYGDALPNLQFVAHCYDAIEAMQCLRENTVDLIFLDLNMPKLKGFEFLRTLQNPPHIIVTTAYQEFALEGYELSVLDYLLKPFSFERFVKAINKMETNKPIAAVATHTTPEETVFFRSSKKMVQVALSDILFIEAKGNYVHIVTRDNNIQVREKISDIAQLLTDKQFIQVHKSFIVAKKHINSIQGNQIVINDHKIPVGKVYKNNVNNMLS